MKAKKEREEKIDKDLDDLLSGKSAEEQKTVADGEESKASESTKAEGEGTTPNEETSEEKKDGTDKKTEAQAEGGETAKAPAQPQFALETNADKCKENILLVVGAKDSGKTTQIQAFLNPAGKDGKHKSTTALEYTYGRKSNGNIKDVAHIWELGGGLRLRSMLPVVIKPANIDRLTVVIVIDLSQTGDAVPLLEKWLGVLRQHTSNALSAMKKDKKIGATCFSCKKAFAGAMDFKPRQGQYRYLPNSNCGFVHKA